MLYQMKVARKHQWTIISEKPGILTTHTTNGLIVGNAACQHLEVSHFDLRTAAFSHYAH